MFVGKLFFLLIIAVSFAGCSEKIVHDVEENHANKILVALAKNGIKAKKLREGSLWSIEVKQNEVANALQNLDSQRLLNLASPKLPKSSSLIQNRQEKDFLIARTMALDLEKTIRSFPGVLEARVHLNLSTQMSFMGAGKSKHQSASVVIVSPDPKLVSDEELKDLISGASGVSKTNVVVVRLLPEKVGEQFGSSEIERVIRDTDLQTLKESDLIQSSGLIGPFAPILTGALLIYKSVQYSQDQKHKLRKKLSLKPLEESDETNSLTKSAKERPAE